MIIAAQKNPDTRALATDLQTRQLQYWLDTKKTLTHVFKLLELGKAGDNLLENPLVMTWLKYAADSKKNVPGTAEDSIRVLTRHYGDEALSKILLEAKVTPSTASVASKLQGEQIQHWLDIRKSPRFVFKFLTLDKAGDKLLEIPHFATWVSYADDFNLENRPIARISVMASSYGDEKLTTILLDAMKTSGTSNLASKLHQEQFEHWLSNQESPEEVFKFLSLVKTGDDLFDNPQFKTWVKYVDDLNKANPDKKTTLMSVLATQYDSERLVKVLESAKNVPSSAKLVKRLELEQKVLLKEAPDDVFKRLGLNTIENGMLSSPQLKTFINYVKEFNAANPKYQTTLVAAMAANYGDVKLVNMLNEAMKVTDTAKVAKKLQSELFQRWMQKGWTPDHVFDRVFHLDQVGDSLFTNPLVITWGKYLSAFNRENHGKETTIWQTLAATGYHPDDMNRMVKTLPADLFFHVATR
ncbi:hypothetical protein PInf_018444 [Phytophthora infestans]|nr:hypothetical protein PInf_018444 [Phytophthora infestans]